MIVDETIRRLRESHGDILDAERIGRLVVGVGFTAVQLSGGSCGLAATDPSGMSRRACDHGRTEEACAPGRWRGRSVREVLESAEDGPVTRAVRMAVLNAVSARVIARGSYRIEAGRDPLEWVDTAAGRTVTLVGAFPSYMDKLAARPCTLRILEMDPEAVPERYRPFYVPADRAGDVLPASDAVLITGSTLVNRTLDGLLALVPRRAFKALVGPSGGLLPDVLFRRGVDVIGTIRILDPELMFAIVSEAGFGFHLFGTCAEKICILHD